MRVCLGLVTAALAAGCAPERSAADAPQSGESAECAQSVERSRKSHPDSLFSDARGLIQSCPDVMAGTLAGLWSERPLSPLRGRQLRAVSALIRDDRVRAAVEVVVRDPAQPIETRLEGLSTLSHYLQAGRWVEFTFLKDVPDSASLRMFMGVLEHPILTEGSHPIPSAYGVRFRELLESLRQSDSSQAVRSAARRFLIFLDYVRDQQAKPSPPPAPPPD